MKTLCIKSSKQTDMIDITRDVCNAICEQDVTDGLAIIFTSHTTAAITINENADPDVCLGACLTSHDRLQSQLFGPYFSSFSAQSYCYELSNEPKSVLKLLAFHFDPYCRTGSLT